MPRPRKTTTAVDPEPDSVFSIGNCKVEIRGSELRRESTAQGIAISGPRGAKVLIYVDGDKSSSHGVDKGSSFALLNPSGVDSQTKALLQEVLTLYRQELPSMDYAADTGKKSGFLEKCTTNGKYKTLILKSSSAAQTDRVIAAVSYQIVPADTQYAEIPLAVVRSSYQRVGVGQLLYKELYQRLQNVGITTIFCWADKVSEGFWLKQGFVSIGEVDAKGKIRKIPVRADIKKALCFPGGATLMVAHLTELPTLQEISQEKLQTSPPIIPNGISPADTAVPSCENIVLQTYKWRNNRKIATVTRSEAAADCNEGSLALQQPKKRIYETSSSSFKSKRIRSSNDAGCSQDINPNVMDNHCVGVTPEFGNSTHEVPVTSNVGVQIERKVSGDDKAIKRTSASAAIILMNIANEQKKARLTEVIELLGGSVTCEGHSCTHIVTGKARRTINFCIALSSGAWIVSPNWLKESFKQGHFVGEEQYVLEDEEYRMQYNCELRDAVMRAKERPRSLFSGYKICVSNYFLSFEVLQSIIKSAGGKIIDWLSFTEDPSNTILVASEEDKEVLLIVARRGFKVYNGDWLMSCVMKQELDLEAPDFFASL